MKPSTACFIAGASAGPIIVSTLYSAGVAYYYSTPGYFGFIVFYLPMFVVFSFAPFGIVAMSAAKFVSQDLVPSILLRVFLRIALGTIGGLCVALILCTVFSPGGGLAEIFSLRKPASEWLPFMPRLGTTIASSLTGILLCLSLPLIFGKRDL